MEAVVTTTLLVLIASPGAIAPPRITAPKARVVKAPEGHTTLRWRYPGAAVPDGLRFELQQAASASFRRVRTRYVGPDRAVFLSGLAEGDAYFRVRAVVRDAAPGPWSRTVVVRVRYVSRRLVWVLMGLGAILLLATLGVIFIGHRRSRDDEGGAASA